MVVGTEPHVVTALEAKRAELLGLIRDRERGVERLRRELAHLDATRRLSKPDATPLEDTEPECTAAHTYFRRGMLAREALALVRAAGLPGRLRERPGNEDVRNSLRRRAQRAIPSSRPPGGQARNQHSRE